MQNQVNIALVDDNPKFLDGLEALLFQYPELKVVAKLYSGHDLLGFSNLNMVDLILMDIEMPGINGFETAHRVERMYPDLKKIAISMYQETQYMKKLVSSGFRGFVSKSRVSEELEMVISRVMNNELVFPTESDL